MTDKKKPTSFKTGFVGFIGLPNAGKSTLLNALVNEKVSIVTPKPQTTRRRVLGIASFEQAQAILVDAPGIVEASRGLNAFLEEEARDVMSESDLIVAVLNIDEDSKSKLEKVLDLVVSAHKPWFYVITKVDQINFFHRKEQLKNLIKERYPDVKGFEFSNQWGEDLQTFRADFFTYLLPLLPDMAGPLYDPELFTPHSLRELVAEIIREKCFEELTHELPYQIAIRIRSFEEGEKLTKIEADILVGKENHKPMVIGAKATRIKQIGMKAREAIEVLLDQQVFLHLTVVVRDNWMENRLIMKELGYVNLEHKRR